jgi:hypothetical protein
MIFARRSILVGLGSLPLATLKTSAQAPPPAPMVSLATFGAAGDGRRDDSQALQAAIGAAAEKGAALAIPRGRYLLGQTIALPAGASVRLIAEDGAVFDRQDIEAGDIFTGRRFSLSIDGGLEFTNCRDAIVLLDDPAEAAAGLVWRLRGCRFSNFRAAAVRLQRATIPGAGFAEVSLQGCRFSARQSQQQYFPFDWLQEVSAPPIANLSIADCTFENGGRESIRLNSKANGVCRLSRSRWSEYRNPASGGDADAHFFMTRSGHNTISDCMFTGLRPLNPGVAMNDSEAIRGGGEYTRIERCRFIDAGAAEACIALKGCGEAELVDTTIGFTPQHVAAVAATSGMRTDCSGILAPRGRLSLENVTLAGGSGAALDFQGQERGVVVRGNLTLQDWNTLRPVPGRGNAAAKPYYSSGSAIRISGWDEDVELKVHCLGPGYPRYTVSQEGGSTKRISITGDLAAARGSEAGSAALFINRNASVGALALDSSIDTSGMTQVIAVHPTASIQQLDWRGTARNFLAGRCAPFGPHLPASLRGTGQIDVGFILAAPVPAGTVLANLGPAGHGSVTASIDGSPANPASKGLAHRERPRELRMPKGAAAGATVRLQAVLNGPR